MDNKINPTTFTKYYCTLLQDMEIYFTCVGCFDLLLYILILGLYISFCQGKAIVKEKEVKARTGKKR